MPHQTYPTKPKVLIELIHDVICSWCPIGLQNIRTAMTALDGKIDFELKFLPYELNPEMPPEGEPIDHHLIRRNGWSRDQFAKYADMVVDKADAVGLTYDYSKRTHYYNTAKAHRLIDFAEQAGQQLEIVDALTEAYFQEGIDISKTRHLTDIAVSIGLNADAVKKVIDAASSHFSLRAKNDRVRGLSVKSTPSLLIDQRVFITGSNSAEFFTRAFTEHADTSAGNVVFAKV